MLAELAVYEPYSFMSVVNIVKSKLPTPKANANAITGNASTTVGSVVRVLFKLIIHRRTSSKQTPKKKDSENAHLD